MSDAAAAAAEYRSSHRRWAFLAAALIIAVLPYVLTGSYWHTNLTVCAINVLLALGLDFILGYAGQLNLGQSAFYGLGAYVSTLLITKFGFPFWGAFVAGVAFAGLSGVFSPCSQFACADTTSRSRRSDLPSSSIRSCSTGSA